MSSYLWQSNNSTPSTSKEDSGKLGSRAERVKNTVNGALNHIYYGKWRRKQFDIKTSSEIWLLGRKYRPQYNHETKKYECEEFCDDFQSRIWFSYREKFPAFEGTSVSTDCGWGCMLRSAQMMLAHALSCLHLGRDFVTAKADIVGLTQIIQLFEDCENSPLGIHALLRTAKGSEWMADPVVGRWYSPSEAIILIRDTLNSCHSTIKFASEVEILLFVNNFIVKEEIERISLQWKKAVIIVIPIRLGVEHFNQIYREKFKSLFTFESCLGIIGGLPRHSLYFVGCSEELIYCLNPHVVQHYEPLNSSDCDLRKRKDNNSNEAENIDDESVWDSFRCNIPTTVKLEKIDPSCAIGFLVKNQQELDALVNTLIIHDIVEACIDGKRIVQPTALFTVFDKRKQQ